LIADDKPLVRTGLRMPLEPHRDWMVRGEAGDGIEALEQAAALRPDVILHSCSGPALSSGTACGPERDGRQKVRFHAFRSFRQPVLEKSEVRQLLIDYWPGHDTRHLELSARYAKQLTEDVEFKQGGKKKWASASSR
jgi:hypothetical protein